MATNESVEANDHKQLANDSNDKKSKRDFYVTSNGLRTSKLLKPRKASGHVGVVTCNAQFTDIETIELLKWLKLDHFHKSTFEKAILKMAGIVREEPEPEPKRTTESVTTAQSVAVADTNQTLNVELVAKIAQALQHGITENDLFVKLLSAGFTEPRIKAHVIAARAKLEPVIPDLF